jgi:hypothetical protein
MTDRGPLPDRELLTIPALRITGIGAEQLRLAVRAGRLPVYGADSAWPRVLWSVGRTWHGCRI